MFSSSQRTSKRVGTRGLVNYDDDEDNDDDIDDDDDDNDDDDNNDHDEFFVKHNFFVGL